MPVPSSLLGYGKIKGHHHNSTFEIITNDFCKSQLLPFHFGHFHYITVYSRLMLETDVELGLTSHQAK